MANLPTIADGGSSADLPPVHPASASLSLGSGVTTIGGTSDMTSTHLARSRVSLGAVDRPHSSAFTNHHRRPLSLAEAPVTSPPSVSTATTANTLSGSIFQTLPSSKKNKPKHNFATSTAQNAATSPPSGHFLGRVLNECDSDDEQIREEICALAARFQSACSVLNSPALSAVLLNYLLVQNHELAPILFYLVAKHYHWMQTHNKEVEKDHPRVFMEIYTTFLHEKSPLCIKVDSQFIRQAEDSISSGETMTVFESCCIAVLPQIQVQVDKLNKDIRHGLDTWKPSESLDLTVAHSYEEELSIYEMIMSPRVNELQRIATGQAPLQIGIHLSATSSLTNATSPVVAWVSSTAMATGTPREQIAAAVCASLVSAYRYFAASTTATASSSPLQSDAFTEGSVIGSAPTCPNTPIPPQHSFRKSIFAKSIENLAAVSTQVAGGTGLGSTNLSGSMSSGLATIGAINWGKLPSFNAKLKSKSSNVIFGSWKTKIIEAAFTQHSQKGHSLQEHIFDRITECAVCGGLIWGLAPQGLSCQVCDISVHHRCRAGLRESCAKDNRFYSASRGSISNVGMSVSPGISPITTASSVSRSGVLNSGTYLPESTNASGSRVYNSWNVRKRKAHHRPSLSAMLTAESVVVTSHHKGQPTFVRKFTSPLEDTGSSSGSRGNNSGSSGLAASTEDIFYCSNSSFNELIDESASCSSPQNPSFSLPGAVVSPIVDEEAKVKRSNSGFGPTHRSSSQAGLTSPEPISRLLDQPKTSFHLMRSSSQVLHKSGSLRRRFFASTLNLGGYVRNVKQKLDNHSYGGTGMALSKHTISLMQLPIMADRDPKRLIGSQNSSSSVSTSAASNVPELLPTWTGDPEMNASETFEAATELRIHFPDYEIPTKGPRVQDYVRTLVLLEFHQKVRYMVCYLKHFDYLLLRRWPKEHQHLADLMALDRIPRLIRLFRSLVHAIERTVEPQGYGRMAEAVLSWLSKDDETNLKAWVRDCQALSCTNMLDSVKAMVREYARKHPDIQMVLETRFNKFVLIESLSQVRILYFNLPLISINIMKDLEKKTSSYKAEAKIWKEIHSKLASIPHSIDKICMPLVKLINDGHFFSTVDKGEQLSRHQAQGGNLPFADLLLQFPRTLFRFWVIDHAEIAVDKLTLTSDNKVNYDYMKERTEVLAVLLDSALVLLVKDGGRYGLRPFKPSKEPGQENLTASTSNAASSSSTQFVTAPNLLGNTMKLSPVFPTDSVFTSLGEQIGQEYMLNMIFKEQAILLRLSFTSEETRKKWLNILKRREQISAQRRLAAQKGRASLPPASTHSGGHKVDTKCLKTICASVGTVQPSTNFGDPAQMVESEVPLNAPSPEPIEKQVTSFTEKISEVEQDMHALIQSMSNSQSVDANEILENLSLKPGDTVFQSNRELIILELLLAENWLKFVTKHLHHLSRSPKWIRARRASATAGGNASNATLTTASERRHQRSKSAIIDVSSGLKDRRRRPGTPSGSIYRDCLEQAPSKTSLSGSKEVVAFEARKTGGLECEESDTKAGGRMQLIGIIHDLQKLVESTSLIASRALSSLGTQGREGGEDSKSENDQPEAFLDAISSLSSSSSSSSSTETAESLTTDHVQETGLEEVQLSDCEVEVEVEESQPGGVDEQGLLERVGYAEKPLTESVSRLDEDSMIPNPSFSKEDGEDRDNDGSYEDELRMAALQLVDDVIDSAGAYEMDLTTTASGLAASAVVSAITHVMADCHRDPEFSCTTDSGISFVKIPDQPSSEEDDELTVTGSKPHLALTPTETGGPGIPFSDLDKLDPPQPPSPNGVSVGRSDSQKSTTSSGYLGSGDEIVQHDWI
ncbi:protein kinase c eta type [Echinococcus multilocularis]|uniref:Protein kinase c eta type n=1 Tax=Echinococcus multilocularis TaxID=6211 RepID=A0A068YI43_ECHMU|nr:protein kinase c eta type [Echinococcus multilocularis]